MNKFFIIILLSTIFTTNCQQKKEQIVERSEVIKSNLKYLKITPVPTSIKTIVPSTIENVLQQYVDKERSKTPLPQIDVKQHEVETEDDEDESLRGEYDNLPIEIEEQITGIEDNRNDSFDDEDDEDDEDD